MLATSRPYLLLVAGLLLLLGIGAVARTDGSLAPYGHHGYVSVHGLALASNLSSDTRFLLYNFSRVDHEDAVTYDAYGRFPVLPFGLIGAALATSDDTDDQITAARALMLAFFVATLLASYRLVRLWSGDWRRAAAVVLLAGSTFYVQFYKDLVFNEMPALFGVVLSLWAIGRYRCGAGRRMIWWAPLIGVSLGWQTALVIVTWLAVSLVEAWRRRRDGNRALALRVPLAVTVLTALVGAAWLGFNLWNEWAATGETSTLARAAKRVGVTGMPVFWDHMAQAIAYRSAASCIPYVALPHVATGFDPPDGPLVGQTPLLAIFAALCLIGIVRIVRAPGPTRGTLVTTVLSGLAWAVALPKYFAPHDFTAVILFPTVLVLHDALLSLLPRRAMLAATLAAAAVFVVSTVSVRQDAVATVDEQRDYGDLAEARALMPRGSVVVVDPKTVPPFHTWFHLSGYHYGEYGWADYVVTANPRARARAINPSAKRLFVVPLKTPQSR